MNGCYIRLCISVALALMIPAAYLSAEANTSGAEPLASYFACKEVGQGRYKPYYMQAIDDGAAYRDWSQTARGLLGQNAMTSLDECTRAIEAAHADFGVICSRTGLDGWKPTIYTGTRPGREDFGYLGGSSIEEFDDCLAATASSSEAGVCFWGGSSWYVSPMDREGLIAGPFHQLADCLDHTAPQLDSGRPFGGRF